VLATHFLDYFGLVVTGLIGVSFILVGAYLKRRLKRFNEDMEEKTRNRINIATYVLSIPFLIRATYIFIRKVTHLDESMRISIRDDTWLAPFITIIYILIADIVPIAAQLVTMVVVFDEKDGDPEASEEQKRQFHEESEYINAIIDAVTSNSTGGSFLDESSDDKKRNLINGSREFSSGLQFGSRENRESQLNRKESDDSD
jgi:hypothetical protein